MDIANILIGSGAIFFGVYTFYLRQRDPSKFKKLDPMKKFWGEKLGLVIHVVGYSVLPIIFGVSILLNAFIFTEVLSDYEAVEQSD